MNNGVNELLADIENILGKDSLISEDLKKFILEKCGKKLKRCEKILKQSDSQQRDLLLLNEELNEYKVDLEKKVDREIYKRKLQEKMLVEQSKLAAMGEMMDAMGHQLKQPLNVISMANSELSILSEMGEEITPKIMKHITETIDRHISHLSTTIDEFRSFLRPDKEIEEIVLTDVIDSVKSLLKDRLLSENVKIEIGIDENFKVKVVKNEFIHLLLNIFNNSIDAFIDNKIENRVIKVGGRDGCCIKFLVISDNAGGIPESILPKIFDANFTTKEKGKGTGIGLYMSKLIIEKIGGSIFVKNGEEGAEFEIIVPK